MARNTRTNATPTNAPAVDTAPAVVAELAHPETALTPLGSANGHGEHPQGYTPPVLAVDNAQDNALAGDMAQYLADCAQQADAAPAPVVVATGPSGSNGARTPGLPLPVVGSNGRTGAQGRLPGVTLTPKQRRVLLLLDAAPGGTMACRGPGASLVAVTGMGTGWAALMGSATQAAQGQPVGGLGGAGLVSFGNGPHGLTYTITPAGRLALAV